MATELWRKNLKTLRKKLGKTQSDIAVQLNTTHQTVGNWETGVSQPSLSDFVILANILGITIDSFLKDVQVNANKIGKKSIENAPVNALESVQVNNNFTLNEPDAAYLQDRSKIMPLVVTVDSHGRDNVVYVPIKARAGYLSGYGDPDFIQSLPAYSLPGLRNGAYRMFEIEGISMYDTLNDNDIVVSSNVEQWRHVKDDRVYVFVTKKDGILIKRAINRIEQDGKFILKSDNITDRNLYPPIVLDASRINEIWYVQFYISKQLRSPAAIYNRLTDVEGRLTLLEHSIPKSGTKIHPK